MKKGKGKDRRKEICDWIDEVGIGSDYTLYDDIDDAFLGICMRIGNVDVAAYDYDKCIDIYKKDGMSDEEAREWFDYNVIGGYVGEGTPVFIKKME